MVSTGERAEVGDVTTLKVVSLGEETVAVDSPIVSLIKNEFPECPDTMVAIARAESRFKPDAININRDGSVDIGIFQINSVHGYDREWLKDVRNNLTAAREIYEKQGLTAWATFNYARAHNLPI